MNDLYDYRVMDEETEKKLNLLYLEIRNNLVQAYQAYQIHKSDIGWKNMEKYLKDLFVTKKEKLKLAIEWKKSSQEPFGFYFIMDEWEISFLMPDGYISWKAQDTRLQPESNIF